MYIYMYIQMTIFTINIHLKSLFDRVGDGLLYFRTFYREVSVVRLISKDTVEEGMLRCARGKLKLEKDITTDESTYPLII